MQTHRIERVRNPFNQRFGVRSNGEQSLELPEATATEIADHRRRLAGTLELSGHGPAGFAILSYPNLLTSDLRRESQLVTGRLRSMLVAAVQARWLRPGGRQAFAHTACLRRRQA